MTKLISLGVPLLLTSVLQAQDSVLVPGLDGSLIITRDNAHVYGYHVVVEPIQSWLRVNVEFPNVAQIDYEYGYTKVSYFQNGTLLLYYRPSTNSEPADRKAFQLIGVPEWLVCLEVISMFKKRGSAIHTGEYAIGIDVASFLGRRENECALSSAIGDR
jgi:hypothetical protein